MIRDGIPDRRAINGAGRCRARDKHEADRRWISISGREADRRCVAMLGREADRRCVAMSGRDEYEAGSSVAGIGVANEVDMRVNANVW
jgi:hypothetical protein